MNFYDILEVQKSAAQFEIKKAFHRLALKHHPDKNFGRENPRFSEIKKAYDILSDPLQRQIYDNTVNSQTQVVDWKSFMRDVMSNMYVLFTMYVTPKDITLNIDVAFADIYLSKIKKVDVRVKRWVDGVFTDSTQSIYILLNTFKYEYVFKNNGDDSISRSQPRSDIIVKIKITDMDENVTIQDVFSPYDLYYVKKITLAEFYLEQDHNLYISFYPGMSTPLFHTGEFSYIMKNMGLPHTNPDTLEKLRGDVFVKLEIQYPPPPPPPAPEFKQLLLKYFG